MSLFPGKVCRDFNGKKAGSDTVVFQACGFHRADTTFLSMEVREGPGEVKTVEKPL